MLVRDQDGKIHEAKLVPERTMPAPGKMDLVVAGRVFSHYDAAMLELVEATDEERVALNRAGYGFKEGG